MAAVVLFLMVFSLLDVGNTTRATEIRLGILLPMTGRWPIGTRMAAAVPMAIYDIINDAMLLPDCNITYEIMNSACNPEEGLRGMVELQTVDLFIGPACSVVTEPAALLAKIWNKPMITYAASSNKFINKKVYSTLGTITAYARRSALYTPKFVLGLLTAFNWTVCAIVSSSEVEWKTMAGKIRITVEPKVNVTMFESYDNRNPTFERVLTKGRQVTRVFLVLCYINEVVAIMEAAKALGMTNGDYAFVTLDLNTDVFYNDGQWSGNEGEGSRFSSALDGIIDLSVYRPELGNEFKRSYDVAVNELRPSIKNKLFKEISWYASFLYDAVRLYALAVNDTLSNGHEITNTSQVLMRMFNKRFQGKSGYVLMENGTRVPQFVVGNLRNGRYKLVANRTNLVRSGSGTIHHELRLPAVSEIVWPGGSRVIPKSVPECGFYGELCRGEDHQGPDASADNLSIILGVSGACCLLLVIFVLLAFVRRRRKEQENLYKTWIIDIRDVTPSDDCDDSSVLFTNFIQTRNGDSTTNIISSSDWSTHTNEENVCQRRIFKGRYQGKSVSVKRICGDTVHLTDAMKAEIRQACEIRHVNLNPYMGVCMELPDVCIVSEHCSKGSLQDILLNDSFKLDWTFRMSFASDIARGMEELNKTSICFHGNLKSTNVVVDGYWICKVTDYGLQSFRKTAQQEQDTPQKHSSLLWTAPEYLRNTAAEGKCQLGDVYSYGIILQEIALRERPFSTSLLSPKEILYYVRKGLKPHCRPHVPPAAAPKAYLDLMTMCWDESPERRPTFSGILKIVKKINNGKYNN